MPPMGPPRGRGGRMMRPPGAGRGGFMRGLFSCSIPCSNSSSKVLKSNLTFSVLLRSAQLFS